MKYGGQAAKGDRWDIKGELELSADAFGGDEDENRGLANIAEEEEDKNEFGEDDDATARMMTRMRI